MVEKVVRQDGMILFFINQNNEYSVWEISEYAWIEYWRKKAKENKSIYLSIMELSPSRVNTFVNDPDNDTLGSSTGMFCTLAQALKYCDLLPDSLPDNFFEEV